MNKNKIMLMYPNLKWFKNMERTSWQIHPYNLGIISAMVEKEYDVKILDCNIDNLTKEEFSKVINKEKPDILGVSILTNEYGRAGFIATEIAKKTHPNVTTIMGGVHATSLPNLVINNPSVDYVVIGEGEYVFKDLCDFLNGKGDLLTKGIAYKKEGKVINTGRADFIQDLNALPYPAYHNIDFMKYATHIQREEVGRPRKLPFAHITTSRGCPHGCCFCEVETISGKKPRLRSVENITGELEWLIKDYGIKSIMIDDDNLLINKKRAKELFKTMINKKYNLTWNAGALSLFKLDEEIIELMEESGCAYVSGAVESGVQKTLDNIIHKPLKLKHARKMLNRLNKTKIDVCANFIVGFPNESWNDIRQTIKFAEEIDVDYVKIAIATPLPNTELYKTVKEKDYLVKGFSFNQHLWTDGWIETKEFKPQDLKVLRAYEWDRINFTNKDKRKKVCQMMNISEKRLKEIRRSTLERVHN